MMALNELITKEILLVGFLILFFGFGSYSQSLYYPPMQSNEWETISPDELGYCTEQIDSLYDFLENENSKAFILLKDGKIVLEQYFNGHNQSSRWYWASAGKTITAFLVGLSEEKSLLEPGDTTSQYLGNNWTSCDLSMEKDISIWNQLTMTSGLDDSGDVFCTDPDCLNCIEEPGERWAYHNGPYTLLLSVLESAHDKDINEIVDDYLAGGSGIGMYGSYLQVGYNRVFQSTARSMARFGLLMLSKGDWNDRIIMGNSSYFNKMINTSQDLNKSYGYLWWLNGKESYMLPGSQQVFPGPLHPAAPDDMYSAMGANGQYLNVIPSQNIVWLRMGETPSGDFVPQLLNNKIAEYISDLECDPNSTEENSLSKLRLYPNPGFEFFSLESETAIEEVSIHNMNGELLQTYSFNNTDVKIPVHQLDKGVYLITITDKLKNTASRKFVKM